MKSLSRVRLLVTPWTAGYQAPLYIGFSRQEYWSGVPLPSPNEHLYGAYYVLAFGLDNNLQCSDDHLYLRYIFKVYLTHTQTHTHIYTYIYFIYNIYICIRSDQSFSRVQLFATP